MGIESMIVGLGMVMVSLMVITRPWRYAAGDDTLAAERTQSPGLRAGGAEDNLMAPQNMVSLRDSIYGMLADLDFDHSVGKLNEGDYQSLRSRLVALAVQVLQEIDAKQASIESQVEGLVRERRKRVTAKRTENRPGALLGLTNVYCTGCGSALKPEDHFCGRCGRAVTDRCPQCDAAIQAGDAFCVHCGSPIADARGATSATVAA